MFDFDVVTGPGDRIKPTNANRGGVAVRQGENPQRDPASRRRTPAAAPSRSPLAGSRLPPEGGSEGKIDPI
jgi:hypothetical protein